MNFGNIVIMMSKFGSKSGDFAQRGEKINFAIVKKGGAYDLEPYLDFPK
ncbi:hypothetical protein MASR1M104_23440 [Cloacibacterium normanense]